MADFHLHVQIISRSSGRSSVAAAAYRSADRLDNNAVEAAAYRSGEVLHSKHDGKTYDYTIKRGVVHTEIILPENAPKEFKDRNTLWNAVEKSEIRKDAQTAREIDVALPIEFNRHEQKELLREYIKENFVSKGMCADFAIHDKKDGNPHAHIMLTTRNVSKDGFGSKNREWNDKSYLLKWRENWAIACNERLQAKGLDVRIDHRTLEAQGIDREPTIHVGRSPERERLNREIIKRNESKKPAAVAEYMNELQEGYKIIDKQLTEITEKQHEIDRLNHKTKNMLERATEIAKKGAELTQALTERESMGFWQNKKEINEKINKLINSENQARNFFIQTFKIDVEAVHDEIERNRAKTESITKEIRTADFEKLNEERNKIILEYQKQLLIAKVRPDGKEILNRIKPPPNQLGKIGEENYKRIIPELRPAFVRILTEKRKEDVSKQKIYERTR